MTILIALLIGLIVVLVPTLVYLIRVQRDVQSVGQQLTRINAAPTNQQLRVHTRNRQVVSLVRQINQQLVKQQRVQQQAIQTQNQLDLAIHNISHDLRTPLTVASGYAQLLMEDDTLGIDEANQVAKLYQNLATLTKHLNLLLLYNRLMEKRIAISLTSIDVSSLLQQETLAMYDAFTNANIQMQLDVDPNLIWLTDEEAIRRIFENVLGNILDHGYQSASIILKQFGDELKFTAVNQMEKPIGDVDKLEERFYSEDLSKKKQNAGLGLYIITEMVKLLNGRVQLSSEGLSFEIEITFTRTKNK